MKVEQAPCSVGFFRSKLMSDLLRNFTRLSDKRGLVLPAARSFRSYE